MEVELAGWKKEVLKQCRFDLEDLKIIDRAERALRQLYAHNVILYEDDIKGVEERMSKRKKELEAKVREAVFKARMESDVEEVLKLEV